MDIGTSNMYLKKQEKPLTIQTRLNLISAIRNAIQGNKVLFLSNNKLDIQLIKGWISIELLNKSNISYKIDDNNILFNTGGIIEFEGGFEIEK